MATCVSVALANLARQMRGGCNRNNPAEALSLTDVIVNGDGATRLDNTRDTPKAAGLQ